MMELISMHISNQDHFQLAPKKASPVLSAHQLLMPSNPRHTSLWYSSKNWLLAQASVVATSQMLEA